MCVYKSVYVYKNGKDIRIKPMSIIPHDAINRLIFWTRIKKLCESSIIKFIYTYVYICTYKLIV